MEPFWLIFFKFCPQNLWHFEDVPLKCPKQFLYHTEFICSRACAEKCKSEFPVFCWFPDLHNLDVFLEIFLLSYFGNYFQAEIVPQSPMFFDFLTFFHMVWKTQESWEIGLDGFWGNENSEMQKNFSWQIFFVFWVAIMDLQIALKS